MRKTAHPLELLETVASLFSKNIPLFASRTDNHVEASAKQSYVFKTYLKGDDIAIQYEDGMVTLTGTVSDESHKLLARETIAGLPGVIDVRSKLREDTSAPFLNKDLRLMTKVKSTLLLHHSVNASKIDVVVKNGIVTLHGETNSSAQKDLTTEYVKDVEGVKKVKNEMTVSTIIALKVGKRKAGKTIDTAGGPIDDASVTALVKATLIYHRSTSSLGIAVETKGGVVKLEGTAGSWAKKNLITKLVADVLGVKMVFNNMAVGRIVSLPSRPTKPADSQPTVWGPPKMGHAEIPVK
jgi:hyperosmotically inducible periplasmic protein